MTALEILVEARRIVDHPGWWTNEGALCKNGQVCALGAIGVASGKIPAVYAKRDGKIVLEFDIGAFVDSMEWNDIDEDAPDQSDLTDAFIASMDTETARAVSFLAKAVGSPNHWEEPSPTSIICYNDNTQRTKDEIVAKFDKAIALAEYMNDLWSSYYKTTCSDIADESEGCFPNDA